MSQPAQPSLARSLSLPVVVLYGLGTTIGAGIYALVGEVAGRAGTLAPLSFLTAAGLVSCSALTFAELCARLPYSAGEAIYVRAGFGAPRLATAVGLVVASAGLVSAATVTDGFAGYARALVTIPEAAAVLVFTLTLGALAAWGIKQSAIAAAVLTVVETAGLILIIFVGRSALADPAAIVAGLRPPADTVAWNGVLAGSLIAFYAFIGFEDMVNVAEEIKDVERIMPRAMVIVLIVTTLLYFALIVTATGVMSPAELAASQAPLSSVYERATGRDPGIVSVIGIVAMVNGALIQMIMSTRILYGLASQGSLPAVLGRVSARTRTPLVATTLVTAAVAVFALWLPLGALARLTSTLMLVSFTLVNASLVLLKRRDPRPAGIRVFPVWVPAVGCIVSLGFLLYAIVGTVGLN